MIYVDLQRHRCGLVASGLLMRDQFGIVVISRADQHNKLFIMFLESFLNNLQDALSIWEGPLSVNDTDMAVCVKLTST